MSASYGHVQASQVGGGGNKNKKLATIGIASLVLVAMVVAVSVGVTNNSPKDNSNAGGAGGAAVGEVQTTSKAVEAICQPTDYKQACHEALSSAGNVSDPKTLVGLAFNATMKRVSDAAKESMTLKELEKNPEAKGALDLCKELMEYAIDDLEHSFERLGAFDITKLDDLLDDLQIWLSAVGAYHETCLDGFVNVTGTAGDSMKKALNASSMLTSNALAMVTEFNTILSSLGLPGFHRRLLEESKVPNGYKDGMPKWVTEERRSLLVKPPSPNAVVAQDGTGQYKTITEALAKVPPKNTVPFVIYIKEGVYKEHVVVDKGMSHVTFVGDGPLKTKITGDRSFTPSGTKTFRTATVSVLADFFMMRDIGVENTAGPDGHQAVALVSKSDEAIFWNCQFDGYQDTLYPHSKRQFFRDCTVSGTIDFVFGDAEVIFQNCKFVIRKPMDNQRNIVTAQGRKEPRDRGATVIQNSIITADPLLEPLKTTVLSYLGRPWRDYSRTIIMNSEITDVIAPEGFLPWMGSKGLDTLFYAEYNNKGTGADTSQRVQWKGIKKLTAADLQEFSPKVLLKGDNWITATGVPYNA